MSNEKKSAWFFMQSPTRSNMNFLACFILHWTKSKIRNKYSQKRKLSGHGPNVHIHVSVSDLYIPTIDLPILLQEICGPILGIYKSLADTWMWKFILRHPIPRIGIHKWNFLCSVGTETSIVHASPFVNVPTFLYMKSTNKMSVVKVFSQKRSSSNKFSLHLEYPKTNCIASFMRLDEISSMGRKK